MTPTAPSDPALLERLRDLAARGRFADVLAELAARPPEEVAARTPLALLAAEAHGRLGEAEPAARWAAAALALARERGETDAELRARNVQGVIAVRRGLTGEAERHFAELLALARRLGDPAAEARGLNNLGVIANLRGDPRGALVNYHLALAAYQQAGLVHGVAETHHNISISWRDLGNLAEALASAERAARLALQAGDDTLLALTLTGRAAVHLQLSDTTLAAAELARAEATYRNAGFDAGLPEVWRLLAAVARLRGRADEAIALLERAAALAEERSPADTVADVERDLGAACAARGDLEGARAAWRRALARYARIGAEAAAAELRGRLA